MSLSAEQQVLMTGIAERVAEIQGAIKRALPGNVSLHRDFRIGEPAPTTPAEAIALGRVIEPLARENKQLLVGRGIDGAKITHLGQMVANLEKLAHSAPAKAESAPAAEEPAPAKAEDGKKAKKKK